MQCYLFFQLGAQLEQAKLEKEQLALEFQACKNLLDLQQSIEIILFEL